MNFLTLHWKKQQQKTGFLTRISETDENLYLFVFISPFGVLSYVQYFFDVIVLPKKWYCTVYLWL